MRVLILSGFLFSFSFLFGQKLVQCGDEALSISTGTLADSSSINPKMIVNGSHNLKEGATGQLSLLSDDGSIRMTFSIGVVRVIKSEPGTITFEVLEKLGVITINGVERSNFKEGAVVQFAEHTYDSPHQIETKWPNGNIKESGYKLCNQVMGEWHEYHENGNLKTSYKTNKEEKIDGTYIEYHDNKTRAVEGTYRYGEKYGMWTEYKKDGEILSQGYYSNGEKTGKWIEHDAAGKKVKKKY
ncbi:MAG: hypothetical protein JNJ99_07315 [Crocinitomicaceae bacterium]|nr:hypothetical protein [Crocinitomicaceae bacterium]